MSTKKLDLASFFQELEETVVDDKYQPIEEVQEGEKVLGKLNESEKKTFIFLELTVAAFKQRAESVEKPISETEQERFMSLLKVGSNLLWFIVKERFEVHSFEGSGLAIRKGWEVVIVPDPVVDTDIEKVLRSIFIL